MSGKKNKFARNPLMYIQQPSISKPKARMQHSYQSSRQSAHKPEQNNQSQFPQDKTSTKRVTKRKPVTFEQKDASATDNDEEVSRPESENQSNNKEKVSFQDMTLEEKIDRLTKSKTHMVPKMRCAVSTETKTFRGIITDYVDKIVLMQVNRKIVRIPFEDIKEIRMLGF